MVFEVQNLLLLPSPGGSLSFPWEDLLEECLPWGDGVALCYRGLHQGDVIVGR